MPRIEINLSKIKHNALILCELYGQQGISLMGVSKAVLGEPLIAEAMIRGGVKFIADSRLENIQRMKNARIPAQFVLLRTALSQAEFDLNLSITSGGNSANYEWYKSTKQVGRINNLAEMKLEITTKMNKKSQNPALQEESIGEPALIITPRENESLFR